MKWSNAKLCDVVLRTRGARGMSRLPAFDLGIGTLPHVDYAGLKIHVRPPKPAQLAKPHSGEDRSNNKRAAARGRVLDEGFQFRHCGEIDASSQRSSNGNPNAQRASLVSFSPMAGVTSSACRISTSTPGARCKSNAG